MTLIFIMTLESTAQESRHQEVCGLSCLFFCFVCFDFPTDIFPLFLSLSLSSYFPFYCAFISYFCFGLACSRRQAGLSKTKKKVNVDFHDFKIDKIGWSILSRTITLVLF